MDTEKTCKVVLLVSGMNIIFEEDTEKEETIWNFPMIMNVVPNRDNGTAQIVFVPLCSFGDNSKIEPISKDLVVVEYVVDNNIKKGYDGEVQKYRANKAGIEIVPAGAVSKNQGRVNRNHPAVRDMKRR